MQLSHYYELNSAVLIDLYEGKAAQAHARVESLWRGLEASLLLRIQSVNIEASFVRARAALAHAALDAGARPELLRLVAACVRTLSREQTAWGGAFAATARAGAARVAGEPERELAALREALAAFEATEMALFSAAVQRRLAALVGGSEGAALSASAAERFRQQAIPDPLALSRSMLGLAD